MARMLGKVAWCCHPHDDYPVPRGTVRQREKRVTRQWLDEYEERSGNCCPVCGDPECQGNGPLEDKWYIGCYA